MPLYDYRCHKCGQTFEVRQKFSDEPLEVHDECGGAVERLISLPALQFKGTGWYVTDYGKGNKGPSSNGSGSGAEKKSDAAKAESKTDSKPAAKNEAPKAPAAK